MVSVATCVFLIWVSLVAGSEPVSSYDEITESEGCGCGSNLGRSSDLPSLLQDEGRMKEVSYSGPKKEDMVYLAGGRTFIGTNKPIMKGDGEHPKRPVTLSPYLIDRYAVTNEGNQTVYLINLACSHSVSIVDFAAFVNATGFITESEKFGWSFVFHTAIDERLKSTITQAVAGAEWWLPVEGSYWKEPEGPNTDVFATKRHRHPVVQVSWNDAVAFCHWRGGRLPTEAEWEVAARGPTLTVTTQSVSLFPWGNTLVPKGLHRMNIFQGQFPTENIVEDGWEFTAPVDAFGPQNDYGLYNMIGNVWEWVEDWHTTEHSTEHKIDPIGPAFGRERVKKGGSFLCHRSFCYRYRTVARFPSTPDSATQNVGFRCARSATADEITAHSIVSNKEIDDVDEENVDYRDEEL